MSLDPPLPKGPPLNALRAFEAAARLGGFALAASELGVTPGAVAQHIKALEDWARMPLFRRKSQGVELTDQGRLICDDLSRAFDLIGTSVQNLRSGAEDSEIRIAALPSATASPMLLSTARSMWSYWRVTVMNFARGCTGSALLEPKLSVFRTRRFKFPYPKQHWSATTSS